jgi:endonuclease III
MYSLQQKISADNVHNLLQALLHQDARSIYNFHKTLLRHGQRVCDYEHHDAIAAC